MSFQAYLNNIQLKTGKSAEDFRQLARQKGLLSPDTKAGEIVSWLKNEFQLGHGHAMAIYTYFKGTKEQLKDKDGMIARHFTEEKEKWQVVYESLMKKILSFGEGIMVEPTASYISLLRDSRKFAIVQVSRNKMIIGIKLKGQVLPARFEIAGNWNNMMTHRVSIISSKELDKELFTFLKKAFDQNVPKLSR